MLQGAARVSVLDINPEAIAVAIENAERNAVHEGFVPLPPDHAPAAQLLALFPEYLT